MSEREGCGSRRPRFRWMFLAALLAVLTTGAAAAVAAGQGADPGRAAEESWAPVTLLYMTDVKGKIEPCG
jgi:hypothetical protein